MNTTEPAALTDDQIAMMKAAALAATPQNIDSAQRIEHYDDGSHIECPACGGEGNVELEADFCNYDGTAIGVQFYGIGNAHGAAEAYLRAATPSNVLALIERLERAESALATPPQTDGATSEDAYVAKRLSEALADVYMTIIGEDSPEADDGSNAIERVKKAAQVLRLEVDLFRSQTDGATVALTLPQPVLDALRFYAHGHHYNIDDDHQQFDTVSGEPQNWLFSERDYDCTMIEDGGIARAVLLGGLPGFEEPTEPLEGEVFAAAPTFDLSQKFVDCASNDTDAPSVMGNVLAATHAPAMAETQVPEGFVLVPIAMTASMINAWSGGYTVSSDTVALRTPFQDAWKRVLAAASGGEQG